MQSEIDFETTTDAAKNSSVIGWIARSYESMDEWNGKARAIFYASNGDSNLSRNRVASMIRSYFLETSLEAEAVKRWKPGIKEPVSETVFPPKVSASSSAYIDWLCAADYVLLACASLSDMLAAENQKRESEYQSVLGSYELRMVVYKARLEMKKSPKSSDEAVLSAVRLECPDAALANVKEARRLEKMGRKNEVPKKPECANPMPRYVSIYF